MRRSETGESGQLPLEPADVFGVWRISRIAAKMIALWKKEPFSIPVKIVVRRLVEVIHHDAKATARSFFRFIQIGDNALPPADCNELAQLQRWRIWHVVD